MVATLVEQARKMLLPHQYCNFDGKQSDVPKRMNESKVGERLAAQLRPTRGWHEIPVSLTVCTVRQKTVGLFDQHGAIGKSSTRRIDQ